MLLLKAALLLTIYLFCGCTKGLMAKNSCATPLSYQTNVLASGDDALRYASIYRVPIFVGQDNKEVSAIVDTGSANLIINERDYNYNLGSATGKVPYIYKNGIDETYAVNAKDNLDLACTNDIPARFSLTAKEVDTDNYLGLGYSNPEKRPQEKVGGAFLDQMSREQGYQNVFSLALCGPKPTSRLVLGGIDPDMVNFIGNLVPILERNDYVVPVLSIRRTDSKQVIAQFNLFDPTTRTGDRVVIDSSSPFLMFPPHITAILVDTIENEIKDLGIDKQFPPGFFRTERSSSIKVVKFMNKTQLKQLPSFEISIMGLDGKAKHLELSPFNYLKEMDTSDPMFRAFAIRDTSGDAILGQPFLEGHYTYFDRKNQLIGFGNIDLACAE